MPGPEIERTLDLVNQTNQALAETEQRALRAMGAFGKLRQEADLWSKAVRLAGSRAFSKVDVGFHGLTAHQLTNDPTMVPQMLAGRAATALGGRMGGEGAGLATRAMSKGLKGAGWFFDFSNPQAVATSFEKLALSGTRAAKAVALVGRSMSLLTSTPALVTVAAYQVLDAITEHAAKATKELKELTSTLNSLYQAKPGAVLSQTTVLAQLMGTDRRTAAMPLYAAQMSGATLGEAGATAELARRISRETGKEFAKVFSQELKNVRFATLFSASEQDRLRTIEGMARSREMGLVGYRRRTVGMAWEDAGYSMGRFRRTVGETPGLYLQGLLGAVGYARYPGEISLPERIQRRVALGWEALKFRVSQGVSDMVSAPIDALSAGTGYANRWIQRQRLAGARAYVDQGPAALPQLGATDLLALTNPLSAPLALFLGFDRRRLYSSRAQAASAISERVTAQTMEEEDRAKRRLAEVTAEEDEYNKRREAIRLREEKNRVKAEHSRAAEAVIEADRRFRRDPSEENRRARDLAVRRERELKARITRLDRRLASVRTAPLPGASQMTEKERREYVEWKSAEIAKDKEKAQKALEDAKRSKERQGLVFSKEEGALLTSGAVEAVPWAMETKKEEIRKQTERSEKAAMEMLAVRTRIEELIGKGRVTVTEKKDKKGKVIERKLDAVEGDLEAKKILDYYRKLQEQMKGASARLKRLTEDFAILNDAMTKILSVKYGKRMEDLSMRMRTFGVERAAEAGYVSSDERAELIGLIRSGKTKEAQAILGLITGEKKQALEEKKYGILEDRDRIRGYLAVSSMRRLGIGMPSEIAAGATSGTAPIRRQAQTVLALIKSMYDQDVELTKQYTKARMQVLQAHYEADTAAVRAGVTGAEARNAPAVQLGMELVQNVQRMMQNVQSQYGAEARLRAEGTRRRQFLAAWSGIPENRYSAMARAKREMELEEARTLRMEDMSLRGAGLVRRVLAAQGFDEETLAQSEGGRNLLIQTYQMARPTYARAGRGGEITERIGGLLAANMAQSARKFAATQTMRRIQAEMTDRQVALAEEAFGRHPQDTELRMSLAEAYRKKMSQAESVGDVESVKKFGELYKKTVEGLPEQLKSALDERQKATLTELKAQTKIFKEMKKILYDSGGFTKAMAKNIEKFLSAASGGGRAVVSASGGGGGISGGGVSGGAPGIAGAVGGGAEGSGVSEGAFWDKHFKELEELDREYAQIMDEGTAQGKEKKVARLAGYYQELEGIIRKESSGKFMTEKNKAVIRQATALQNKLIKMGYTKPKKEMRAWLRKYYSYAGAPVVETGWEDTSDKAVREAFLEHEGMKFDMTGPEAMRYTIDTYRKMAKDPNLSDAERAALEREADRYEKLVGKAENASFWREGMDATIARQKKTQERLSRGHTMTPEQRRKLNKRLAGEFHEEVDMPRARRTAELVMRSPDLGLEVAAAMERRGAIIAASRKSVGLSPIGGPAPSDLVTGVEGERITALTPDVEVKQGLEGAVKDFATAVEKFSNVTIKVQVDSSGHGSATAGGVAGGYL